jgi:hypothetical protein
MPWWGWLLIGLTLGIIACYWWFAWFMSKAFRW